MNDGRIEDSNRELTVRKIIGYFIISFIILLGVKNSLFTILAFAALALFFFAANLQDVIESLFFFIVFSYIFKLTPDSTSIFTYLQIIPIVRVLFAERRCISKRAFILSITIIMYALFLSVSCSTPISAFVRFLLEVLLLLACFGTEQYRYLSARNIVLMFSYGVIVSSLFGTMKSLFPEINSYISLLYVRIDDNTIAYRFSGLIANSNYYSIDVTIALAGLFILYRRKYIKRLFYLLSIPMIVFGIMSQSKSFIISLFIIILFYLYYTLSHKQFRYVMLGLFIVTIVGVAFIDKFLQFSNLYLSRIYGLLGENYDINQFTTGRWDIWMSYLRDINENVIKALFGHGLDVINASGVPAHNTIIQSIYCIGWLGTTLFVFLLNNYKKGSIIKSGCFLLFALMIIRFMAANLLFYMNTYYYLMILFACIHTYYLEEKEN